MKKWNEKDLIASLSILMFSLVFFVHATVIPKYVQFIWQAQSFLRGRFDITDQVLLNGVFLDSALHGGRYYWPLGPLPSLIFLPFASWSPTNPAIIQVIYHLLAGIGIFFLAHKLAVRCGVEKANSWWLAYAFCFSSVMIGPLFYDDYCPVAQVTVALLMLAALYEYKGKNRPLLIGSLMALTLATRLSAGLAIGFFLITTSFSADAPLKKVRRAAALLLPALAVLAGLAWFNFARFGNAFDGGYAHQIISPYVLQAIGSPDWQPSLTNFFRNFYYYFMRLPEWRDGRLFVDPLGTSVFLVMPAFLWLALERKPSKEWLAALTVAAVMLSALLLLPYSGYAQIGPRYVNDFLPLLFLMLSLTFAKRKFTATAKAAIAASSAVNFALFAASLYWGSFGVL